MWLLRIPSMSCSVNVMNARGPDGRAHRHVTAGQVEDEANERRVLFAMLEVRSLR